jgi:prevent-host-death family protein
MREDTMSVGLNGREWQLQEAKAKLSEVIKLALASPQTITVHGRQTAVVLSMEAYRKLAQPKRGMSLYDVLQNSPFKDVPLDLERDRSTEIREIDL